MLEANMETLYQGDVPTRNYQTTIDRLRQAIDDKPGTMTLQLARQFKLPEVEVIRNFPADRAVELDISSWEQLIRSMEAVGHVRVLVSNYATTMEAVGRFGGFSTTGEFFNIQTESLDLHLRWQELSSAFAVEKPGHIDGNLTQSIQFFDQCGNAALKIFLSFGEPVSPEVHRLFEDLRGKFRARTGAESLISSSH